MNVCPNCNKKSKHPFCPECGTATVPVLKKRRAITVSGILCTLILIAFLILLPVTMVDEFAHAAGASFAARLAGGIAGGACTLLLGLWLWGMIRWTVFAVPYTFRAMKSVVSSIIPLSFLAVVAEVMFGIWLTLLPMAAYGMTTSVVIGVAHAICDVESIPVALLLLALSAVAFWLAARKEIGPIVKFFRDRKASRVVQA